MMHVGEVVTINRYPVKSFAGESLESCKVETYGLQGDRAYAFYDHAQEGWDGYVTARSIPQMLSYQAKLYDDKVCVTSQDQRQFGWNRDLLAEIQQFSKKEISMLEYQAPNVENPNLLSVDMASLLIVTDASLQRLEKLWAKNLDNRRFRSNIVISLNDKTIYESDWIGKQLWIGNVKLSVDQACQRCSIVTMDPDTLDRESSLLTTIKEKMGLCFGLYASINQTGEIRLGEKVYVVD